jgi:hypothetical protein
MENRIAARTLRKWGLIQLLLTRRLKTSFTIAIKLLICVAGYYIL